MVLSREKLDIERVLFDFEELSQEVLFVWPDKMPAPGVIFIHGHASNAFASLSRAIGLVEQGYAVCLPTMMGYGFSEGEADYCGPKTIDTINEAITLFIENKKKLTGKLGIWGVSRGGATAAQIITQNNYEFQAAVLECGVYDFEKDFNDPHKQEAIKANMSREMNGASTEELRKRSAILNAENITTPTLILHGDKDLNINVEQAIDFDKKLSELGVEHETHILEDKDHFFTRFALKPYIYPFLERYLKT